MIAYFPTPYPDELLYSQLARYYAKSGYTAYAFAAEDLYQLKTVRPDMEFINTFTEDALKMITRDSFMEEIILKRTMFPYYGRFLPKERRLKAFQALVSMQGNYYDLLPIPKKIERYLRYCPLCSAQDRQNYGETFWHRTHQMIGMKVCPVHKCYLIDSSVPIRDKAPPRLRAAEEVIPLLGVSSQSGNELECHVAKYMTEVFQAEVDLKSDVMVGHFLQSKLANTQYHTLQGKKQTFYSDFIGYYKNLSNNQPIKPMRLDRSNTVDFYEVCLMAGYLKIPVSELVSMELPERTQPQLFKGSSRPESWQDIDKAILPHVKRIIAELQGDEFTKPKKVSVYGVERILNLPSRRIILHLPQCYTEIKKHEESKLQYWARVIVWAANQIQFSRDCLTPQKLYSLTNLSSKNLKACLPYIGNYADEALAKQLRELV